MTAAEIRERASLVGWSNDDIKAAMLAEIAAQLAEMNQRSGVFEFQGEAFNRAHISFVSSVSDRRFRVFTTVGYQMPAVLTEAPGATREDFVRLWKGE